MNFSADSSARSMLGELTIRYRSMIWRIFEEVWRAEASRVTGREAMLLPAMPNGTGLGSIAPATDMAIKVEKMMLL